MLVGCIEAFRKCIHTSRTSTHNSPAMPHKAREADSCGSGAEMVSNGGYQTTAHTMGDPVMDVWKIKNWSESGSNDRAYSLGYITLWNEGSSFNV